jgi:hypothetical protein
LENVSTTKIHAAATKTTRGMTVAQQRTQNGGFAATRLSYKAKGFSLIDRKGNICDHVVPDVFLQVVDR